MTKAREAEAEAEGPKTPTITTVYHPTILGVSREISTDAVQSWTDAGWRETQPKH